jgi:hypothetical protein
VFLHQLGVAYLSGDITVYLRGGAEDGQIDALSALRIALFVPSSISRLTCHIIQPTTEGLFFHLIRLKRFVANLSLVGEVNLHLTGSIYNLELEENSVLRQQWLTGFSMLCDALIVAQCERLVVKNGDDERVYVPRQDVIVKSQNEGVNSRWNAIWRRIRSSARTLPVLKAQSRMTFALQSLSVSPSLLRCPDFSRDSAYSVIQCITITSLCTQPQEWSEVLPAIASATSLTLCQLSIRAHNIFPVDIFPFLSRLQRLTTLTLTFTLLETKRYLGYHPKLPLLTTLSAPPNYASILFASHSALRNLQSLDIYLPHIGRLYLTVETISGVLCKFNKRKSSGSMLTIPFDESFRYRMSAELVTSLSKDREKYSLALLEGLTFIDFFLTSHAASPGGSNDLLTFILPRWLTMWFPNLKHLTFSESSDSSHNYSRRIHPFLYVIYTRHPNVQTVTFGDECYDMTSYSGKIIVGGSLSSANGMQFLDLPDDILYLIFSFATSTDIYALSMLSYRLQLLALPTYLSHQGLPDQRGTWHTSIGKGDHDQQSFRNLSVVRRLPSAMHLQTLTIFSSGNIFMVFDYLQQLQLVVTNLSGLEKVELDFYLILRIKLFFDKVFVKRWDNMLRSLVDVILQKTSASLWISGPEYWGAWVYTSSSKEVTLPNISEVRQPFINFNVRLTTLCLAWTQSNSRTGSRGCNIDGMSSCITCYFD